MEIKLLPSQLQIYAFSAKIISLLSHINLKGKL